MSDNALDLEVHFLTPIKKFKLQKNWNFFDIHRLQGNTHTGMETITLL